MIKQISQELYLISLDQGIPGFKSFIGAWLYKGEKNILIDPGPACTIPVLINGLKKLEVKHLDFILLTHIHIDHAGGIGDLILHFPDTPVVCHKSGIKHVSEPSRLWQGSVKTLGDLAKEYGEIKPIPKNLLIDSDSFKESGVIIIPTPGHSVHHISFLIEKYLFIGEAAGIFLEISKNEICMRPATPPRFFLETTLKSIDALLETEHNYLCYGHFGITDNTPYLLEKHKEQLVQWADIIKAQIKSGTDNLVQACIKALLKNDPFLSVSNKFKGPILERELYFMEHSVLGFIGYFSERS